MYIIFICSRISHQVPFSQMARRVHMIKLLGAFAVSVFVIFMVYRERERGSYQYEAKAIERKALSIQNSEELCIGRTLNRNLRTIYMITPTYKRAEQVPELVRTGQTLLHVSNLKWIVVEDAPQPTEHVREYLERSGLDFVLLAAQMPSKYSKVKNKPRGVANRNKGLEWVRQNSESGVVYFGDDDNTYDIRLFEEIRSTQTVSLFPVGLVAKQGVSSPIVKNGKLIGFFDGWIAKRKFPVDMAGFAISVELLLKKKNALMPFKVGYEEDQFLQQLGIKPSEMELKANNCTQILVWHTQTKKNFAVSESVFSKNLSDTNIALLRPHIWTRK